MSLVPAPCQPHSQQTSGGVLLRSLRNFRVTGSLCFRLGSFPICQLNPEDLLHCRCYHLEIDNGEKSGRFSVGAASFAMRRNNSGTNAELRRIPFVTAS